MAAASKRRPWVVEIKPPGAEGWYELNAYADETEARMQAALAAKRAPKADTRYRSILSG